jgi:hypothetical protein
MTLSACIGLLAVLAGCSSGVGAAPAQGRTAASAAADTAGPTPSVLSPPGTGQTVLQSACHAVETSWSTFLTSYRGHASLAEKNLDVANAALAVASAQSGVVNKLLPGDQNVLTLINRLNTFFNDFETAQRDLEAGETSDVDSMIGTRLQDDENAVSAFCGPLA